MSGPPSAPYNVLVVEDDDDHATLFERALRRALRSVIITRVADGSDALSYLHCEPPFHKIERPDVVVLDLKLPGMSGHDVLRQIKQEPVLRTIPVVIVTTSNNPTDRARAYESGANSYLVKPLDAKQYQEMVSSLATYWLQWNTRAN